MRPVANAGGTTPAAPAPASGGGGGGGVAVSTAVSLTGITGSGLTVDASGVTGASVQLTTSDDKATIGIAAGTIMQNASGTAVTSLSVAQATAPAHPPQGAVLFNYDFGPSGATFNPPLVINLTYDETTIPAGAKEADLYAAFCDGSHWVKLASFVDTGKNTISALVPHFTNIAVVYAPTLPPGVSPVPTTAQTPSAELGSTPTPSPAQTPPSEIVPIPTLPPSLPPVASTQPPISLSPAAPGLPPTINWGLGLIAGVLAVFIVILVTRLFRRPHRA